MKTADLLQGPVALATSAATLVGAFAAVRWNLRYVLFVILALAGTVLWVRRQQGRPWRTLWTFILVGCCVTCCAVLGYSFVPRAGSKSPGTAAAGSPAKFTVGRAYGPSGNLALPAAISMSSRQLSALNSMNEAAPAYAAWFDSRDSAYTGQLAIELQAQGNRDHTVRVINIVPDEKCTTPLTGTLFYNPAQGVDSTPQLFLDLNDPARPASYVQDGSLLQEPDYFGHYSISLRQGEQQTFQVTASVRNRSCQFTLNVSVIDNGRVVTENVSDNGRPFRITSLGAFASYQDLYVGGVATGAAKARSDQYFDWARADPKTYRARSRRGTG